MSLPLPIRAQAELERRRRSAVGIVSVSPYDRFRQQYRNDPAAFAHDCYRWPAGKGPYQYHDRILEEVAQFDRVSVRSPHGAGKTACLSWIIDWFALTRDGEDWKAPITASAWRQLLKYLWPEVHKWSRLLDWSKIGRQAFDQRLELQTLNLKLKTGEAFTMASDNPELIEGAHGDHLLYIFDESKAIPDATWDSAEGAFSNGHAKWLAFSTPGEPAGRFYEIQSHKPGYEDWHVLHITLDDCVRSGAITREWAEARARQWGENSQVYLNRVKGEFAESAKDSLIPLAWIEAANERWLEWQEAGFPGQLTSVGVDVGGGGDEGADKSTLAPIIDGVKVLDLRVLDVSDPNTATMQLVGTIAGILEKWAHKMRVPPGALLAVIDAIGVGLGALHRMRELGYLARAFVASKGTQLRDKTDELGFADWRSCAWWMMREMLEPGSGFNVCLPPDTDTADQKTNLTGDLTAPRWTLTSDNRVRVETKEKLRLRIHRSTDCGDAVLHGIVGPILLQEEDESGREYFVVHER